MNGITRWNADEYNMKGWPSCSPQPCPPQPCPTFPKFEGPWPPWYKTNYVSFGSAPPAYPARGNLWWNGIVLQIFDGAGWLPVGGAGDVTGTAAAPGAVGQVVTASLSQLVIGAGADQNFAVSLMVPSGDWNVYAAMSYAGPASGIGFVTAGSPVAGLMPQLAGQAMVPGPGGSFVCSSSPAWLLTTVAVTLSLMLTVSKPTGQLNSLNFQTWARRMR